MSAHLVPLPSPQRETSSTNDDAIWDEAFEATDDSAPHIPQGEYTGRVVQAKLRKLFKSTKRLVLTFEIVQSKWAGTHLDFYADVRTGKHSRFREAWEVANGGPAKRRDRMSLSVFRHHLFDIRVRDVTHNRFQRKRARPYSVVDAILGRQA